MKSAKKSIEPGIKVRELGVQISRINNNILRELNYNPINY